MAKGAGAGAAAVLAMAGLAEAAVVGVGAGACVESVAVGTPEPVAAGEAWTRIKSGGVNHHLRS